MRDLCSLALLLPLLAAPHPAQDSEPGPTPLTAEIAEVTVYSGSASVRRVAPFPRGGGAFVVSGLPRTVDPGALRVRTNVGEVVGVELRERVRADVPEERVRALRERVRELESQMRAVNDEGVVLERLAAHLDNLARRALGDGSAGDTEGKVVSDRVEAWSANLKYLTERLTEVRASQRENEWRAQEVGTALTDARLELGRFESTGGVVVYDLHLDVFDPQPMDRASGVLVVDTIVSNAGWSPTYDLRAPRDLGNVELVYRARVWQRTGEDWSDVDLLLSTAQPQRGAQGPDPRPTFLSIHDPRPARGMVAADALAPSAEASWGEDKKGPEREAAGFFASSVSNEGLSVRFRLPSKETIESRDQPTTVLVGREPLALRPEHVCVPALDTTVWLRGEATNTSAWEMLPGPAAVYFGADFVGYAELPTVRRGEEFTVHLGPDPGVGVERTQLVDRNEEPGTFGSTRTLRQAWRTDLTNHGAFSRSHDGAVTVIVHEVLPRAQDDRIDVEIERAEPTLATGERWTTLREEKGVLTWAVRLPASGKGRVELETAIGFPEDLELVRQ